MFWGSLPTLSPAHGCSFNAHPGGLHPRLLCIRSTCPHPPLLPHGSSGGAQGQQDPPVLPTLAPGHTWLNVTREGMGQAGGRRARKGPGPGADLAVGSGSICRTNHDPFLDLIRRMLTG